jgi:hypothetical protein
MSAKVLWIRSTIFLKIGMLILIKPLDSNGVGVNRKEKGVILRMMGIKPLIIGVFPTKPLDSNMLGEPCPIFYIYMFQWYIFNKYFSSNIMYKFHRYNYTITCCLLGIFWKIHVVSFLCNVNDFWHINFSVNSYSNMMMIMHVLFPKQFVSIWQTNEWWITMCLIFKC